jgi:hypothetical protein
MSRKICASINNFAKVSFNISASRINFMDQDDDLEWIAICNELDMQEKNQKSPLKMNKFHQFASQHQITQILCVG